MADEDRQITVGPDGFDQKEDRRRPAAAKTIAGRAAAAGAAIRNKAGGAGAPKDAAGGGTGDPEETAASGSGAPGPAADGGIDTSLVVVQDADQAQDAAAPVDPAAPGGALVPAGADGGQDPQRGGKKLFGGMGNVLRRGQDGGRPKQQGLHGSEVILEPDEKRRHWELMLSVRSFEYVGRDSKIDAFFSVSLRPDQPKLHMNKVKLLPEYTPAYILQKGVWKTLDTPIILYRKKTFALSYKDLRKHVLKVDMWRISPFTFNCYYGSGTKTLWDVATREANMSIRIKQKLTVKEEEERRKKNGGALSVSDIARFECTVNLEELFDFHLLCENWNLDLAVDHPDYKRRLKEKKCLTFIMPKHDNAVPMKKKGCHTRRVEWKAGVARDHATKFFWTSLGGKTFIFRGTRTALSNQYFIVNVHSGNPAGDRPPLGFIGSALMGLTSVLDISVFKGRVKALDADEAKFNVGVLQGSVKCIMCALNETHPEEIPGGRPDQPKTSATVSHLKEATGRHLVVRVLKCEGLAVADPEKGASDPYIRVNWDNMDQRSPVLKNTLRPVFNHNFYFPVRLFNRRVEKRAYLKNALMFELKSKGDIQIQVWDDDDTSADSLGFARTPMRRILDGKRRELRTLTGAAVKEKETDNEFAPKSHRQWYEKELLVPVYDGGKTELTGCFLPNSQTAIIHFEAWFYPEWPEDLEPIPEQDVSMDENWRDKEKLFDKENILFSKSYALPFPDSIGAKPCKDDAIRSSSLRRFPCLGHHPQTHRVVPLMAFLVRIITPEEYSWPAMLLHWINCITFHMSSRQERQGEIPPDGWKDPQYMLFTRKGPAQDHAMLLCSVLLGSERDAYVCKGTVWVHDENGHKDDPPRLVEHVWVMTREENGWITFWEPCTREVYHLPHRWRPQKTGQKKNKKGKKGKGKEDEEDKDDNEEEEEELEMLPASAGGGDEWVDEVRDVTLEAEDIDGLPTVGRVPRAKQRVAAKSKLAARERLKAELTAQREKLPQAPKPEMLNMDEGAGGTFVDWLPYDSIDIVFNMEHLYANHQNHHPACIKYDFEVVDDWSPLLKNEEDTKLYKVEYINTDVLIDPPLKLELITRLERDMITEMEENMRLFRGKRGHDTFFDRPDDLKAILSNFLHVHEQIRRLDIDFCPIFAIPEDKRTSYEKYLLTLLTAKGRGQYNKYGTPFRRSIGGERYNTYNSEQEKGWDRLLADVTSFMEGKKMFPTRKGKTFTGMPIHFNTADKEQIRTYLMQEKSYLDMLDDNRPGVYFTAHCKIYPLLGGIQSTWLYFGVQSPSPMDDKEP
mmetsp:Transcript_98361/g.220198  ORF Transcript_98361/g.220198 Transcript_98361/m.220198 type:complete len:1301 (+) Transcript_98361:36-3938(+)